VTKDRVAGHRLERDLILFLEEIEIQLEEVGRIEVVGAPLEVRLQVPDGIADQILEAVQAEPPGDVGPAQGAPRRGFDAAEVDEPRNLEEEGELRQLVEQHRDEQQVGELALQPVGQVHRRGAIGGVGNRGRCDPGADGVAQSGERLEEPAHRRAERHERRDRLDFVRRGR
jgi:hypothetical protein